MLQSIKITRRAAVVGLALGWIGSRSAAANPQRVLVLFICQFGSVKSAVAREMFRRRAAERGVRVDAISRGITPQAHMAPALATALKQEGINPASEPLRKLTAADLQAADVVILFDPLPPGLNVVRALDWTDTGSFNNAYSAERPRFIARIDKLIDDLARR